MNQAYQNLLNVLARQKQANDALIPGQMAAPGPTPESLPAGQQMLVEQRYAATAANELGMGTDANPAVQLGGGPETINLQMNAEVGQKAAALEKAAREYARDVFSSLVEEDNQKVAAQMFAQLPAHEQQAYLEEAQKVASMEAQGFVATEYGWVHQSQFVR